MKNNFEKLQLPKSESDGMDFQCDICQDEGCQNCQGEYRYDNDVPIIHKKKSEDQRRLEKEEQETKSDIEDDGLSFICEYCQDAEGGCPQCGFGAKQARRNRNK